jgi:hypothetical protein
MSLLYDAQFCFSRNWYANRLCEIHGLGEVRSGPGPTPCGVLRLKLCEGMPRARLYVDAPAARESHGASGTVTVARSG